MHPFYSEFVSYLDAEDKEKCVRSVFSRLAAGEIDLVTLYDEVLKPAVNSPPVSAHDSRTVVWLEHVRTSIVRTIIECCYQHVLELKEAEFGTGYRGKIIIACPADEYHDLGARMACDFFTLCGYNVTFIGANTPESEIITAVEHIRPLYVGISVSNYYHLVNARKLVTVLSNLRRDMEMQCRIIVGGSAFQCNPGQCKEMGADMMLQTYDEIKRFCESEKQ